MKKFFDAKFAETLKIDKKRQPQFVEVCIYIYFFFQYCLFATSKIK